VVRGIHTLLNNCLEQAVAERLILSNPAKGCRLPKLEKREMKILPEDKIGPYLAEAERRGLLAAFYLELTTGLRRGELLALLWTDLDVENMTISVSKQVNRINGELVVSQPKTPNSIRKLAIPQRAVELLVEEHSKHPHSPYLFVSPKTGTMFDPDSFRHTHEKILKAIGAEHIRFHDLRHTFATLSLKYGVDVKTLSGALGHYDAGFTLSTYTHATAEMKRAPPTPSETSSVRQCKYKKIPREGRMILSAPLPYFRRLGQRLGQAKTAKIPHHFLRAYVQKSSRFLTKSGTFWWRLLDSNQ